MFLDLGGTDDPKKVTEAFLLMAQARPTAVFLNIFGGVTRCDTVANGLVEAMNQLPADERFPLVARIRGNNEKEGIDDPATGRGPSELGPQGGRASRRRARKRHDDAFRGSPMSVLVDSQTRVLVQGIDRTPGDGPHPSDATVRYPGRRRGHPGEGRRADRGGAGLRLRAGSGGPDAGERQRDLVPAPFAKDALIEAVDAGIKLSVVVTEHIPFHDMLVMYHYSRLRGARIIGPNCPAIAAPGKAKVGMIPNVVFAPGRVGAISRSGTLTYEIVNGIKEVGLGQSTCIGLGGDPVVGTNFVDALPLFEKDPETDVIVMVGEIGGTAEEEAAEYIHGNVRKPVVAYVAGSSAPPGKRMGHAGAIIARGRGTAESKRLALERAGATVARFPYEVPLLVAERVKGATRR